MVYLLVERYRADLNPKSRNGNTPLHAATASGKIETVEYLLSKGADYRVKNSRRQTPFDLVGKNADMRAIFIKTPGFTPPAESGSLADLF